jgi:phosphoglucomutase
MGKDTHALSRAAERTALEVLAAHGVNVVVQSSSGYTPTPVISHAILQHNHGRSAGLADGIVITPSHNPPADGGFKYNPPHGGPADTDVTSGVEARANELLKNGGAAVKRLTYEAARRASTTHQRNFVTEYVADLGLVLNLDAVRNAGLRIGVDPLGGAAVDYWEPVAEMYGLDLVVVHKPVDAQFAFMRVDHDGKIRMDCSSPYAMAGLVELKDRFDIAFGTDPDADRHGIVTPTGGLMNPNHYLAAAVEYLYANRPQWGAAVEIGKTMVSSSVIDLVARELGRGLLETPVGFKFFAPGLFDGSLGFGGEESAGASFLRKNGRVWSTDKDGLILGLLAAEILAVTGRNPQQRYLAMLERFGVESFYTRVDTPATPEIKSKLKGLKPEAVTAADLAGDAITERLIGAPRTGAALGGLKVATKKGWFAARPSGTENLYKIYAESFVSAAHLQEIVSAAREMIARL